MSGDIGLRCRATLYARNFFTLPLMAIAPMCTRPRVKTDTAGSQRQSYAPVQVGFGYHGKHDCARSCNVKRHHAYDENLLRNEHAQMQ